VYALIWVLAMTTRLEVEVDDSSLLSTVFVENSRTLGRLNCAKDLDRSLRDGNVTPNSSSDLKIIFLH
jgi:hypothetical protein